MIRTQRVSIPRSRLGIVSAIASRISWSSALRRSGLSMRMRTTASAGASSRSLPEASPATSLSLRAVRVAQRALTQRQDDQHVAFAHGLALLAADLLHGPVVLRLDRDLHLHRLEDDDGVAVLDLVPDRDLDFPHVAGDVRLDVWPWRGRISAHDGGVARDPMTEPESERHARLAVIVAARNEADRIAATLAALRAALPGGGALGRRRRLDRRHRRGGDRRRRPGGQPRAPARQGGQRDCRRARRR